MIGLSRPTVSWASSRSGSSLGLSKPGSGVGRREKPVSWVVCVGPFGLMKGLGRLGNGGWLLGSGEVACEHTMVFGPFGLKKFGTT